MIRFLTAGESHGQALVAIVEGVPAGLEMDEEYLARQLRRRQLGYGRGGRMAIEHDRAEILSGVRFGQTLGSPIALLIRNRDWENWCEVMSVGGSPSAERKHHVPRPGHADLVGALKYNFDDLRNVLERASARETAARVAAGTVATKLLEQCGVSVISHVTAIGDVSSGVGGIPWEDVAQRADQSSVRCADPAASELMEQAVAEAREVGDTLGGIFEVVASGLPPGLGSYVHWDRRLDARLACAVMSIPGVKGVEIGLALEASRRRGSQVHDEIIVADGGITRASNRAGGLEGGVTNGQPVVVRGAMKPISTLRSPLRSVDLRTGQTAEAGVERSDVCAVPAAGVVGEAVVAVELANAMLEKLGGDTVTELMRSLGLYWALVRQRLTPDRSA